MFNQHYIDNLDSQFGLRQSDESLRVLYSNYTARWNSLFAKPPVPTDFNDIETMFEYVFAHVPPYALVHTTEMYYYYAFQISGGEWISGNFRLVEAEEGRVGMGYFKREDPTGDAQHKLFSVLDGLSVEKKSPYDYLLTFKGMKRWFRLSDFAEFDPSSLKLWPDEEFIAHVRDESGVIFNLVFNSKTSSFYYLLDDERPYTERVIEMKPNIFVGLRTDFAFYQEPDSARKILFGVKRDNVRENNYFDGAFDQVPPFLDVREKIYKAYPYTQFGGIDPFGNFLNVKSTRVAISPYTKYRTVNNLDELLQRCIEDSLGDRNALVSCLTYEDKRDYHRDSPMFTEDGQLKKNLEKAGQITADIADVDSQQPEKVEPLESGSVTPVSPRAIRNEAGAKGSPSSTTSP